MKRKSRSGAIDPRTDHRWGVILAGGDGSRLQHFIKNRFGEYRPKQYCALIGKRSMLRHTIDRVAGLFAADRLLTTVSAHHLPWAMDDLNDRLPETVIIQPLNRETGPGILLSILHIHHLDPKAVVALFPADHFILQEERYRMYAAKAMEFVADHPDRIVLLGIAPSSLQHGYGWIEKGETTYTREITSVKKFWEKPDAMLMHHLHEKKCLWNTMTMVGSSLNFLTLIREHMAAVYTMAERIVQSLGTVRESDVTEEVFRMIPSVNFSRSVLEKIPEKLCVLQISGVYWNDWGDETRILSDIGFLEQGEQAAFRQEVHHGR